MPKGIPNDPAAAQAKRAKSIAAKAKAKKTAVKRKRSSAKTTSLPLKARVRKRARVAAPARQTRKPVEKAKKAVMTKIYVRLEKDLHDNLQRFLVERDLDFDAFLHLSLRSAMHKSNIYGLNDQIRFGKYYGERLETVIKADPEYIDWAATTVTRFNMKKEGFELLEKVRPDLKRFDVKPIRSYEEPANYQMGSWPDEIPY